MDVTIAPTHGFLPVNGLRLHYLQWGHADAPPIVLLHGLRGSAANWQGVAEVLAAQCRVIALDQRGRGDSDWDPAANYTTEAYVSDLDQVAQQLGLGTFVLLGHSMGGTNAFTFAAGHPARVRALVVEDMGPRPTGPQTGMSRTIREVEATPVLFASWPEAEAFMRTLRPTVGDERLQRIVASSLKGLPDGTVTWRYDLEGIRSGLRARQAAGGTADLWPAVRALKCPTLVLHGERSDVLDAGVAAAMAAANPHVCCVEIPGATHFVHDDNLADYTRELMQFLGEAVY